MKKIIFCLILMASLKANSQIVDTTIKSITAMKIQPVITQINFPKKDTITHIGLRLINDNLSNTATFEAVFLANGKNIIVTTETIKEEEYTSWNGSNTYPFTIIVARYGFTFKNN